LLTFRGIFLTISGFSKRSTLIVADGCAAGSNEARNLNAKVPLTGKKDSHVRKGCASQSNIKPEN